MTPQQAVWVAESRRRIAGITTTLRTRAAEDARSTALPILSPTDLMPHWPGIVGRLWSDRGTCRTCGRNLRRTESLFRECWVCETQPWPLKLQPEARINYGCCSGHGYGR